MIGRGRGRARIAAFGAFSALAAAALGIALAAGVAYANGRPPTTDGIYFRPGDPHALYVASTFGLLVSRDDGCTVRWICEADLGRGTRSPAPRPTAARCRHPRTPCAPTTPGRTGPSCHSPA